MSSPNEFNLLNNEIRQKLFDEAAKIGPKAVEALKVQRKRQQDQIDKLIAEIKDAEQK